jgi:hypothetical protein
MSSIPPMAAHAALPDTSALRAAADLGAGGSGGGGMMRQSSRTMDRSGAGGSKGNMNQYVTAVGGKRKIATRRVVPRFAV